LAVAGGSCVTMPGGPGRACAIESVSDIYAAGIDATMPRRQAPENGQ